MKKALCVGCNYAGTDYALSGCINDATDWGQVFTASGFNVSLLLEEYATKANILAKLEAMVVSLHADDVGAFSYSGHGTWVPDQSGDEPDHRDEAICPVDMGADGHNLIIDDQLATIYGKLRPGARLIVISDSCHSGTVFRLVASGVSSRRPRFLPPSHFIQDPVLFARMERAYGRPTPTDAAIPGVVFYSGCRDTEYSCDANINGRPCGAFSYFATRAFISGVAHNSTYAQVHQAIRKSLPNWDYQQTPQLTATLADRNRKVMT